MGRKIAGYLVLDGRCPVCEGPLTTPRLSPAEEGQHPATPETVLLCVFCVARVLVRATLALHGPPTPYPESNRCPGHEERMQGHQDRVTRELAELEGMAGDA